jgi:DNA replication protein DnaC
MSGPRFHSELIDCIRHAESERRLIQQYVACQFLILSDPLPLFGDPTEYQARTLFQLIDQRYRHCRPIIATLNVASGDEAVRRLGAQVVSRLKHDALILHCNWPDYRERKPSADGTPDIES